MKRCQTLQFQFQVAPLHSGDAEVRQPDRHGSADQRPSCAGRGAGGGPGRGVIENKHSTDIEFPPVTPHVRMSIHTEGESRFDVGRVFVLNVSMSCGIRWLHDFPPVYQTGGHGKG